MKVLPRRWLASACILCLALPVTAFATNGYFLIGFGAKSRGMGGVGVAYPQDGLAAAANPASIADVDMSTMRIDVGADLFSPPRAVHLESSTLNSSEPNNTADLTSGANLFLVPNMGGVYRFNRKLTFGFAAIGAGLGTRYNQAVPGNPTCHDGNSSSPGSYFFNFNCAGTDTVGVMLMQMQMLPTAAYKITSNQTVGVSPVFALQTFRAYGLQAFSQLGFAPFGAGGTPSPNLTNRGNDWSYGGGIRLGWLGKFMDERLNVGVNYASRVYMTRFTRYRDLFAEHGTFDIPTNYAIGFAYKATPKVNVAFDIERVRWSTVASVGHKGPDAANPDKFFDPSCVISQSPYTVSPDCLLGGGRGLGFGWQDRTIYKLGMDYKWDDHITLRAGLNYSKTPIPNDQILFNLLAPATVEKHLTLGGSYSINDNMELSFSWVHAFRNTVKGPTVFGPAGSAPVIGSNAAATMYQNAVGMSFGYKL